MSVFTLLSVKYFFDKNFIECLCVSFIDNKRRETDRKKNHYHETESGRDKNTKTCRFGEGVGGDGRSGNREWLVYLSIRCGSVL